VSEFEECNRPSDGRINKRQTNMRMIELSETEESVLPLRLSTYYIYVCRKPRSLQRITT